MKIIILGGTGFIGSNLIKLLESKKQVFDYRSSRSLNILDLKKLTRIVRDYDVIINLVGLSGVTATQKKPADTIAINTIGQLNLLEACRSTRSKAKIIFLSSRLEYGKVDQLPIKINSPFNPSTIYGISKYAATKFNQLYHNIYGLKTITLRVSNPFGPQSFPSKNFYNIVNYFIYSIFENKNITLFGKGNQKRDYIYIKDLCEVIYQAIKSDRAVGETINIGGGNMYSLKKIAKKIINIVGKGKIVYKPWPKEWGSVETGDSCFDLSHTKKLLHWQPRTKIDDGLIKTISFLKNNYERV